MEKPIRAFNGKYRFLSNFYPAHVDYNGHLYQTSEHAYQAAKATTEEERRLVAEAPSPGEAKILGRSIPMRPEMERPEGRISVMREVLRAKFDFNPDLRQRLLDTGDAELVEGNTWNDTFWGVYRGEGENHLGRLLMELRDEIRAKG